MVASRRPWSNSLFTMYALAPAPSRARGPPARSATSRGSPGWTRARIRARDPHELEPVHARASPRRRGTARTGAPRLVEGLLGGDGDVDLVAGGLEDALLEHARRERVVHDQDRGARRAGLLLGRAAPPHGRDEPRRDRARGAGSPAVERRPPRPRRRGREREAAAGRTPTPSSRPRRSRPSAPASSWTTTDRAGPGGSGRGARASRTGETHERQRAPSQSSTDSAVGRSSCPARAERGAADRVERQRGHRTAGLDEEHGQRTRATPARPPRPSVPRPRSLRQRHPPWRREATSRTTSSPTPRPETSVTAALVLMPPRRSSAHSAASSRSTA